MPFAMSAAGPCDGTAGSWGGRNHLCGFGFDRRQCRAGATQSIVTNATYRLVQRWDLIDETMRAFRLDIPRWRFFFAISLALK